MRPLTEEGDGTFSSDSYPMFQRPEGGGWGNGEFFITSVPSSVGCSYANSYDVYGDYYGDGESETDLRDYMSTRSR